MLELIEDPPIIDCTEEKIPKFIQYCQSVRSVLIPMPSTFIFGEQMKTMCSLKWNSNETSDFKFFYALKPTADDFFYLKEYNGSLNFSEFSVIDDGEVVDLSYEDTMQNLFPELPLPVSWQSVFTEQTENSKETTITGMRYKKSSFTGTFWLSGVGFDLDLLVSGIESIASDASSGYLLINSQDQVYIDSHVGKIPPITYVNSLPVFPTIQQLNNSFWNIVNEKIDLLNDGSIVKFEYQNEVYTAKKQDVKIQDLTQFSIIITMNTSTMLAEMFSKTSIILVLALVILSFLFFVAIKLYRIIFSISKKKKHVHEFLNDGLYVDPNAGSLSRSVTAIRTLQLECADEAMLNKILDSAVASLTLSRELIFGGIPTKHLTLSQFEGIPAPPPNEVPLPYAHWQSTTGRQFAFRHSHVHFSWIRFSERPVDLCVAIFGSTIRSLGILFSGIDPDALLSFVKEFLVSESPSVVAAALRVHSASYLLSGPFKGVLPNKIDELIVLLAALCGRNVCEECPDPALVGTIAIKAEAAKHANDLLRVYINHVEDGYLERTLTNIISSTDPHYILDLIGELNLISQNPEFSIAKNSTHRLLLIRVLAKICDVAAYWVPSDSLQEAIADENDHGSARFIGEELRGEFHFTVAEKVVAPLLFTLNNFVHIDEIVINFKRNLSYLGSSFDFESTK